MESKIKNYLFLIGFHIVLGILIYLVPFISKIYGILIIVVGLYFIIKTRNKNNEVLYAAAYVVGSEVFLRMTLGNPNHEFSKYSVIVFLILGMFYSGFSKSSIIYTFFLALLVPGIVIGISEMSLFAPNLRKTIMFNISGEIALGISALYCYDRKITIKELNNLLLIMGLPIISCSIYLILFTPELKEILTGTSSNSETSGGFGPNQVSTCLGLGMFIFFSRVLLESRNKTFLVINLLLALNITYRGLITFSRGGMITGFIMIIILVFVIYVYSRKVSKLKLLSIVSFLIAVLSFIWIFTEIKTGGLISKRYANQDALGKVKSSRFTGREELAAGEIDMFLSSPFLGIGVGKGTELRTESMGFICASHNEITRLLAEHGSLGILILMILFFTPIFLYIDNKQNIYIFCFIFFWLLTLNHASTRTAAPSFIYALSLLKVKFDDQEETVVRRKQVI
ncbi:O-antigen ligase family protein [Flavobacterium sp. SUN052]|uniref:O-antigen ligase family protein n=1 Tax=Flavobacterium sp. SUN052 TaxID=3002441 RepID=UPI00237DCECD|nr:O-antigen ligase family protein [Flavobacterium sp. SUN052]MEC4004386.1 O-antigen ligase family protein [Flavobacterium sp. SUN052]